MDIFFYLYLFAIAINDWQTMYFSKWWVLPSLVILGLFFPVDLVSSCMGTFLFGGMSILLYHIHHDWIGVADVAYLSYFGFLLGYERMTIALLIGISIGLVYAYIRKAKTIPFLTCLSLGCLVAWWHGYELFYTMLAQIWIR